MANKKKNARPGGPRSAAAGIPRAQTPAAVIQATVGEIFMLRSFSRSGTAQIPGSRREIQLDGRRDRSAHVCSQPDSESTYLPIGAPILIRTGAQPPRKCVLRCLSVGGGDVFRRLIIGGGRIDGG